MSNYSPNAQGQQLEDDYVPIQLQHEKYGIVQRAAQSRRTDHSQQSTTAANKAAGPTQNEASGIRHTTVARKVFEALFTKSFTIRLVDDTTMRNARMVEEGKRY